MGIRGNIMMEKKAAPTVSKERFESEMIKQEKRFMNELAKVDKRVTEARKEAEQVRTDCIEELNKMQMNITNIQTRYNKLWMDANGASKQALGEIIYLKSCFDDVVENVNITVDNLNERFKPLMDFAETMKK